MKKFVCLVLALALALSLCACSGGKTGDGETKQPSSEETTLNLPSGSNTAKSDMFEYFNAMEYTVYQNIFWNSDTSYDNTTITKEGTFTKIYDAYNETERYYVWGFADNTKCCDFQWEFVPAEGEELPPVGSHVKLTGKWTADTAALDGYWFTESKLEILDNYKPATVYDYDTTTMSATLARVQLANMQYKPDYFNGSSLRIYGRVFNTNNLQHPYYDETWYMDYNLDAIDGSPAPAIGQYLILGGTWTASESGESGYLVASEYLETE